MIKLIGYGNPARGDDGLGPAFADWAEQAAFADVSVRQRFQLGVDEADWIRNAAIVVFVDAALDSPSPYRFRAARPDDRHALSTHSSRPETVLALARTLYGATPDAFVLEIAGTRFGDIQEGLSDGARGNLMAAERFFLNWMSEVSAKVGT